MIPGSLDSGEPLDIAGLFRHFRLRMRRHLRSRIAVLVFGGRARHR